MLEIAGVSKTFNGGTPNELRALRGVELKVAIEKDLDCIDAPPSERDPDAFPRTNAERSC